MTILYRNDEASKTLFSIINRLGMACESGDKQIDVLTLALSTAINQLNGNTLALSKVAQEVKDCLDDEINGILRYECETDIDDLNEYSHYQPKETFQLAFDIVSVSAHQQVNILNDSYDEESIIKGLKNGELATTTWFKQDGIQTIDMVSTGEKVAVIISQEMEGEYSDYRPCRRIQLN